MDRILVTYRVRADAASIAARAQAIAVEQSVEMPVAAIDDRFVLDHVVGRVEDIAEACVYLAADSGSFITGQVLHLNGGQYMY